VATGYNLQKIIRDIAVCIDFTMFKVNIPVKFSATWGFPLRRDGR
jgi:hypothetical protein